VNRDRSKGGIPKRVENTREERKSLKLGELMTFSFKDFDETQPAKDPQTLEKWQKESLLKPLFLRLIDISKLSRDEAVKQAQIKVYGDFPPKTDFTHPKHVDQHVSWGVIKSIGGQKGTVAGYIIENTFYIVFLDQNHRFWISEKKNT
jgi:hypothetical protein